MNYLGGGPGQAVQEARYSHVGQTPGSSGYQTMELRAPVPSPAPLFCAGALLFVAFGLVLALAHGAWSASSPPVQGGQEFLPLRTCDGDQSEWPADQRDFCCKARGVGCDAAAARAPAFDCDSDVSSWLTTWSEAKRSWCCKSAGRGCDLPKVGTCLLFGETHVETFDGAKADLSGEGVVWLIKSANVSLQVRLLATPYTNGLAATHDLAISGPILRDHVLRVGPMKDGRITWDGREILDKHGEFDAAGLGRVSFTGDTIPAEGTADPISKNVVNVYLADGFFLEVFRWQRHINAKINMRQPRAGSDGHCGDFDSDKSNDARDAVEARLGISVEKEELLFSVDTPRTHGKSVTLGQCPDRQAAARACTGLQTEDRVIYEGCLFDACFAGARYAAEEAAQAW